MDPTLFAIIALVLGLGLGYFLGHRFGMAPVKDWQARHGESETRAKELDEKFRQAIVDLENASVRADRADALDAELRETRKTHEAALDELRRSNGALTAELATLKEKTANFDEQKRLLIEAREELLKEFQNTGSAVLTKAQEAFLERANERLGHSEKTSEEKLKALLDPVGKRLEAYEKQVAALEEKRTDAFGRLYQQITEMQRGQELVRAEAERLGSSLRAAPKASGRWGELQVKNVLEKCGLSEKYDFVAEKSVSTDAGRLRPDFVVDIPGGKQVIIDAKNIWRSYDASLNAPDEPEKERLLKDHTAVLRGHIKALSQKSYSSEFEGSSDYVVLFVPGEHLLYSALERDDQLWNFAFESNVLLATPTNLVAICRTVATVWQHEGLAQNAKEIGKIGTNLYDSLAKTQADIVGMGNALQQAVNKYNQFTTTYDSNVVSRARMLREKDIAIKKREVDDAVHHIEATPQLPKQPTD